MNRAATSSGSRESRSRASATTTSNTRSRAGGEGDSKIVFFRTKRAFKEFTSGIEFGAGDLGHTMSGSWPTAQGHAYDSSSLVPEQLSARCRMLS